MIVLLRQVGVQGFFAMEPPLCRDGAKAAPGVPAVSRRRQLRLEGPGGCRGPGAREVVGVRFGVRFGGFKKKGRKQAPAASLFLQCSVVRCNPENLVRPSQQYVFSCDDGGRAFADHFAEQFNESACDLLHGPSSGVTCVVFVGPEKGQRHKQRLCIGALELGSEPAKDFGHAHG